MNLTANTFQVPNILVDEYFEILSPFSIKVYLFIVRKTRGWNKQFDTISRSQFREKLSIKDDRTLNKALAELEMHGLILEEKRAGKWSQFSLCESELPPTYNVPPANDVPPTKNVGTPLAKDVGTPPTKDAGTTKDTTTKYTNNKRVGKKKDLFFTGDVLIDRFIQHRIDMKKPMTKNAIDLFVKKVNTLEPEYDVEALINIAIMSGWQMIYLKDQYKLSKNNDSWGWK